MRGYNVISEMYHGNLRPCDRGFRNDTDFAITMEAFAQQEDKLRELLTGEGAERFDELMSCHNNIVDKAGDQDYYILTLAPWRGSCVFTICPLPVCSSPPDCRLLG